MLPCKKHTVEVVFRDFFPKPPKTASGLQFYSTRQRSGEETVGGSNPRKQEEKSTWKWDGTGRWGLPSFLFQRAFRDKFSWICFVGVFFFSFYHGRLPSKVPPFGRIFFIFFQASNKQSRRFQGAKWLAVIYWGPGDSIRDLFGMVKTWPFQGVKWPPTIGDEKGTAWITWEGFFDCQLLRGWGGEGWPPSVWRIGAWDFGSVGRFFGVPTWRLTRDLGPIKKAISFTSWHI